MINLHDQIILLKNSRRLFHSEADFQFALAWEIQKSYPKAKEYLMQITLVLQKYFNIEKTFRTKAVNDGNFPTTFTYNKK